MTLHGPTHVRAARVRSFLDMRIRSRDESPMPPATRTPSARLGAGGAFRRRRLDALALTAMAVILVAAVLVLVRLDQRLLWVDEAETALLARSILVHGVPTAWDGRNLVSQEVGQEYGADHVWRWTPWLEKYLTAASFAVLGESTFSARAPFALLAILTVASVYPLAVLLFGDRRVAVLAMAALTLSVPFLLHARQCRYYSPAMLAGVWTLHGFIGLARGRRGALLGFVAAMTAQFHANTLTFFASAAALVPCVPVVGFDRRGIARGALATVAVVALAVPWTIYFDLAGKTGQHLYSFAENLRFYSELTARYTFPAVVVPLFLGLAWAVRRRCTLIDRESARPFASLLVFLIAYVVALSAAPWGFYRYTAPLLPVAAVLIAFMCVRVSAWNRLAGVVATVSLAATGLLHAASAWPIPPTRYSVHTEARSFPSYDLYFPLGNYLYEVTHDFDGPMEHLVAAIREQARADDRIFITYGDLVLQFYTEHEVRGGQSGRSLHGWAPPDWIVLRSFFRFGDRPELKADARAMASWLNEEVPREQYEQMPAPWTDVPWDDIAEPQLHFFRIPEGGKPMELFRRAGSSPSSP
jgi:hypothetical protein